MWTRHTRWVPLVCLALLSAAAMAQDPAITDSPAATVTDEETSLLRKFAVAPELLRTYQDEDGKPLGAAEFLAKFRQGAKLSVTKSNGFAQFKLLSESQVLAFQQSRKAAELKAPVGQLVPDFQLTALDGQLRSNKNLLGRYSVINFFFAACAPCIAEVPSLNAFQAKHPELNLWAVTFDDVETTRKFLARYPFQWQVLPNSRPFNKSLGISSYPGFALVNPQGKLIGIKTLGAQPTPEEAAGKAEHIQLAAWVRALIAIDKAGG